MSAKAWRENDDVLAAIRRQLRAYRNRHGTDVLTGLEEIRLDLEAHLLAAVEHLRSADGGAHSWGEIARVLGISRQAAQQRFRKAGGVRAPGGQPARWR